MDRDELLALIRNGLSISIDAGHRYAIKGDGHWYEVTVTLTFAGEEISSASTTLDILESGND